MKFAVFIYCDFRLLYRLFPIRSDGSGRLAKEVLSKCVDCRENARTIDGSSNSVSSDVSDVASAAEFRFTAGTHSTDSTSVSGVFGTCESVSFATEETEA